MMDCINPGVRDSSGMMFTYTATRREHDAGILFAGHRVTFAQIIPPNAENYSTYGVCPGECTQPVNTFKENVPIDNNCLHSIGFPLEPPTWWNTHFWKPPTHSSSWSAL